jgi:HKD family nuclease
MEVIFNELEPKNHLSKLRHFISQSDEIILCSCWVKIGGLRLLSKELESAIKRNAVITIISNRDHTDTKSTVFLKKYNLRHIVVDKSLRYFHAKMYYFKSNEEFHTIIGSANLTSGALRSNEELSVLVSGQIGDCEHRKISMYLERLTTEYIA